MKNRRTISVCCKGESAARDAVRWRAVVARDLASDGKFVFGVKTTGIYCRPSCPAKRPLRANVFFFSTAASAEAAGLRPCLRCRPQGPTAHERASAVVAAACRAIEQAETEPNLRSLADSAGLSPSHFHRIFRSVVGLTPKAYATEIRARRTRQALSRRRTVTEAIYEAGFNSNSRFYADASATLGMKPRDYQKGGAGETIRFAFGKCSLGSVLVAASASGICAILLGDDPHLLRQDVQHRFPQAILVPADSVFKKTVATVVAFIEAPGLGMDLPLDIRGTVFQRRVWEALRDVPPGSTISYAALAGRLGLPKSVRAVARACGANAHAVAIPCHRVLRRDGALSGYRWGIGRKKSLLERENSAIKPGG